VFINNSFFLFLLAKFYSIAEYEMYSVVTCKMDRYVNIGLYIQSYLSYTFEKKIYRITISLYHHNIV